MMRDHRRLEVLWFWGGGGGAERSGGEGALNSLDGGREKICGGLGFLRWKGLGR